ncbi:hypothetical protein GGR56DRAFT_63032 [Xylariaceae sp. FL0804]|nr:hypothetical protein GGR56DRAFT_63032 [Xylariaceae sp. FL0804]
MLALYNLVHSIFCLQAAWAPGAWWSIHEPSSALSRDAYKKLVRNSTTGQGDNETGSSSRFVVLRRLHSRCAPVHFLVLFMAQVRVDRSVWEILFLLLFFSVPSSVRSVV